MVGLDLGKTEKVSEVHLKFDSNLSRELMVSLSHSALSKQTPGIPPQLVREYSLEFYDQGRLAHMESVSGNYKRFRVHKLAGGVTCDSVKVRVAATNGDSHARIFEVRIY